MKYRLTDWQYWILQNLEELSKIYGKDGVGLNGKTWRSIFIMHFALPTTWRQKTSRLFIVLPEKSQVLYTPPERFYLNRGLKTIKGDRPSHYFESYGFNDMASYDLARFSFHLKQGWKPSIQCQEGTNLVDVLEAFYMALDSAAREAMK